MEIDIRDTIKTGIEIIRFADEPIYSAEGYAVKVVNSTGYFYIEDEDYNCSVRFEEREQVENCILAMQKALDMGWVD